MKFLNLLLKSRGRKACVSKATDLGWHLSKLNSERLIQLAEQYRDVDPYPGFSKYLDAEEYVRVALCHLQLAGLVDRQPLSLLDIGTGAGYFPFVCSNLGHDVLAVDVPSHPFYTQMTAMLGVNRFEHRIEPFQPLPNLGKKFHFVTGFAICFNGHATEGLWGPAEWSFFLDDLKMNHTHPGAVLFFKLNREPDGQLFPGELSAFFQSKGAMIDQDMVRFQV